MSKCSFCVFGSDLCPLHCPVEETKTEVALRTAMEAGIPVVERRMEATEADLSGLPVQ